MADIQSTGRVSKTKQPKTKSPSSWDLSDDLLLRHLKEKKKLGWKEIATHFPSRTSNACQFRWRRISSGTLRRSASAVHFLPINHLMLPNDPTSTSNGAPAPATAIPLQHQTQIHHTNPARPYPMRHSASLPLPSPVAFTPSPSLPPLPNSYFPTTEPGFNGNTYNHYPMLQSVSPPLAIYNSPNSAGVPVSAPPALPNPMVLSNQPAGRADWTREEEDLLRSMQGRNLRLAELSVLLPNKSETEIKAKLASVDSTPMQKAAEVPRIVEPSVNGQQTFQYPATLQTGAKMIHDRPPILPTLDLNKFAPGNGIALPPLKSIANFPIM